MRRAARHNQLTPAAPSPDPLSEITARELVGIIDDELARLPETYRLPLLLCALVGLSREEAAARLGWSPGAVKGRLERGREHLRTRLEARGMAVPAMLASVLVTDAYAVPARLIATTSRAAGVALTAPAAWVSLKTLAAVGALLTGLGTVALVAQASWERERPEVVALQPPVAHAPGSPEPRVDREGVPLPPGALARIGSSRMRHAGSVYPLDFTPDGRTLTSLGPDGVRLWDVTTGKPIRHFPSAGTPGEQLRIAADGRHVLVLQPNDPIKKTAGSVRRLDLATGMELSRIELRDEKLLYGFSTSESGNLFAVSGMDKTLRVHEAATAREILRIPTQGPGFRPAAFAPDDRTIAVVDLRDVISLHDLNSGRRIGELKRDAGMFIFARFSPDGRTVATVAWLESEQPHVAELWDVATRTVRVRLSLPFPDSHATDHVSFSPDGRLVATCSQVGKDVILWEAATGKEVRRLRSYPTVLATVFSPDGRTLAAAHDSGSILLWDPDSGRLLDASANPAVVPRELRFGRDGRNLIGRAGPLIVWDTTTGREVRQYPTTDSGWGIDVLSPDERLIASFQRDRTIRVIDAATGHDVRTLRGEKDLMPGGPIRFTPDGKRLVAGDVEHSILVFDVGNGDVVWTVSGRAAWAIPSAISPDGRWLAAADRISRAPVDNTVHVWDLTTFQEVGRLTALGQSVGVLAFSPDSRRLATIGFGTKRDDRGAVQFWDVPSARHIWSAEGVSTSRSCLAFAPDGRTVAICGEGNAICLLETATRTERHRIHGHVGEIHSIAFSSDGRRLAASSDEAPVYIWDALGLSESERQPAIPSVMNEDWVALAAVDAKAAYRAIRRLVAAREPTVAYMHERLRPAAAADAARVRELVGQLDSPRFAERQKATSELEKLGDAAAAELRAALKDAATVEVRQAVQRLLDRIDAGTPDTLRAIRAVEVLEHIATPAAREHLKTLAAGQPGAELTVAAAAALKRLEKLP